MRAAARLAPLVALPLLALPLLLAACAGAGSSMWGRPIVPGQFTQACANGVIGGDAPPALLVQVRRSAVRAEHDAYFVDGPEGGRVALTRLAGPATARHEAARQAAAQAWGRPPTPQEFRNVERRCGAAKRRGLG